MTDAFASLQAALSDRYHIEHELGSGGMATVYLAEDLKHHRKVAVKVLRPELAAALGTERFLREIEIAANLAHPHIVPIHDSGEADGFVFYVMPHIEGESLRDRLNREKQLSVVDAVKIAGETADALQFAHDHGVIHRDIKPENILLEAGHAVIADFGIALALNAVGGARLTETGMSLGTPDYMSPEQIVGEREIDGRSDIYSVACVLYEMLAGEPPFTGTTAQAVLARHIADVPPPITTVRSSVPAPVAKAIVKALGKTPADRFESAKSFAEALVVESSSPESEEKSVVVLPFENLSPDPDNEYFADGLTEEIITDLSQVGELRVVSRTSAMMLKGAHKSIHDIARDVNVQYVLEGTVRRAGDSLRITAQLVDTRGDAHVWAGKFGGTMEDVFAIQEKVSREIVDALKVKLSPEEVSRIAARPVDNVGAYEGYLKAVVEVHRFREKLYELKDKVKHEHVDVKAATKILLDMIKVLGFEPDLLEETTNRAVVKPGHCPIYETGRSLGLAHDVIRRLCVNKGVRLMDLAARELNPRLRYRLIQFRSGPDDSCIEELVMKD